MVAISETVAAVKAVGARVVVGRAAGWRAVSAVTGAVVVTVAEKVEVLMEVMAAAKAELQLEKKLRMK